MVWMKVRNKAGYHLPGVYERHLWARQLGCRDWEEVEDMPHLELMLKIDLLSIDAEVAEWRNKHPRR